MSLYIPDSRFEETALFVPHQKPFSPVRIDWTSPLTNGLRWVSLPQMRRGANRCFDNIVNEYQVTPNGIADYSMVMLHGEQIATTGSSTKLYFDTNITQNGVEPFVVLVSHLWSKTPAADIGIYNVANQKPIIWWDYISSEVRLSYYGGTATPAYSTITHLWPVGSITTVAFSVDSSGHGIGYVNGVQELSASPSISFDTDLISSGSSTKRSSYFPSGQLLNFWMLWKDRIFPEHVLADLSLNPYQFLIPQ